MAIKTEKTKVSIMNHFACLAGAVLPLLLMACGGGSGSASSPRVFADDFYLVANESRARSLTGGSQLSGRTSSQIWNVVIDRAAVADTLLLDSYLLNEHDMIIEPEERSCSGRSCRVSYQKEQNLIFVTTPSLSELFPNIPLPENTTTNSIDIREIMSKGRVSVAQYARRIVRGDSVLTYKMYGGWLAGSAFGVIEDYTPASGGDYSIIHGFSLGNTPSTNPRGRGRAEWRGLMIGLKDVNRNVVQGDAIIDIDDLNRPSVDVFFSNIKDLVTGDDVTWNNFETFGWNDLVIRNGYFNSGDFIEGSFYGENHQEVGGVFHTDNGDETTENDGITGAFGGVRQ